MFCFYNTCSWSDEAVVTIRELGCNTEINDFKEWFGPLIHIDFYRVVYRKLRNRKKYVSV